MEMYKILNTLVFFLIFSMDLHQSESVLEQVFNDQENGEARK